MRMSEEKAEAIRKVWRMGMTYNERQERAWLGWAVEPESGTWILNTKELTVMITEQEPSDTRCRWLAEIYDQGVGFGTEKHERWPRPYMTLFVAKSEVVEWVLARGYEPVA